MSNRAVPTGGVPARRTRRQPQDVRLLVLTAAEEVFTRCGFADASTVEIARRAGVQRSVVYRHFGSKLALFRQAMAQPFLRFIETWTPPPADSLHSELPDALLMRHFVAGLYAHLDQHRDALWFLLLRDDELDPEMRTQVHDAVRNGLGLIREAIRQNLSVRGFPSQHVDIAVRAVVSLVVGLITVPEDLFGEAGGTDDDLVLSYVSAMLMHGLSLRPAARPATASTPGRRTGVGRAGRHPD